MRARAIACLVALSCLGACAHARVFPRDALLTRTLPNGIRVLVLEAHDVPVVAVEVIVRGGSSLERPGERGLAHVLEHMVFQRPVEGSPSGALPTSIESLGGEILGDTTRDTFGLTATVAPEGFEPTVQALAEALLHPVIEPDRLRAELSIMAKEFRAAYSQPLTALRDGAYGALYPDGPYTASPGGGPQPLSPYPPSALLDFHARNIVGANLAVIVVGDIAAQTAFESVAARFGELPAGAATTPADFPVPEASAREVAVALPTGAPRLVGLAWPAPGMSEPREVLACDVLLALLDHDTLGALARELPERLPANAGFGASYLTQRLPGMLFLWAAADAPARDAAEALRAVLRAALARASDPEAIGWASRSALLEHARTCETVTGLAQSLGFYEGIGDGSFAARYEDEVLTVTGDEVLALATKYFDPDRAAVLIGKGGQG